MATLTDKLFKDMSESTVSEEILTYEEYLSLIKKEPWITRNSVQILHDMLLSSGVEHSIVPGKPVKHKYKF
ncbi:MAG: hypothetical protein NE330_19860, partial [Lentisphaeraceae bacterium]|nr:hypothetical protein [Lentisphaeraceae bacterium]